MKNREILCIDLGSSFTKLAVRYDWNGSSDLVRDQRLALDGPDFCFPSTVARLERKGKDIWVAGAAAAREPPGDGTKIIRNWKAGLFAESDHSLGLIADTTWGTPSTRRECETAAVRYLSELLRDLKNDGETAALADLPVRILVPRLADSRDVENTMHHIVSSSGWRTCAGPLTVAEPNANVLGALTRGRNIVLEPPTRSFEANWGPQAIIPRMMDPGMFREPLWKHIEKYTVLIVDIGAFTTDFGLVVLDEALLLAEGRHPWVKQVSVKLGIRNLDSQVIAEVRADAREAITNAPDVQWERLKKNLYEGNAGAISRSTGGVVQVGQGNEVALVRSAVDRFASSVLLARGKFLGSQSARLDLEIHTGGGAVVPLIRESLQRGLPGDQRRAVYDLTSEALAREAAQLEHGASVREEDIDSRLERNRDLIRGASAIGGSSVFFEDKRAW